MLRVDDVLRAYHHGYFPMSDPADGKVYWCQPYRRAIVPLESYTPTRVVRRLIERREFEVCIDRDFEAVIRYCAAPRKQEKETWISGEIIEAYTELHRHGHAHSVECYRDGELAGGLYGLSIGSAFFGESMFHLQPNASKVAFDRLVVRLLERKYELLDAQIINSHLRLLGAIEIEHEEYMALLYSALSKKTRFI
ncbi:leucyl/phenylalanyl-tRNA--protein transferase [Prosthecochloris sp. GSB1]|uniref:leucyl/phenylalanyl-tRNA--protein transferase n=1 Tax=Prosthecochloris sp. GSB1 TaxID=281093 RepID=UPI000B8C92C5|nr:leucyl/phenylalanyl-tRNA--protein transferase [Prosthecochloris sp. GSB1]ASQ91592.1 leucyl/phenylalanyl-tRNA--protein transferase [Prosthecochloris sp. GSB1]